VVVDSDDEDAASVAPTSVDQDSCRADPLWTDAQPLETCSPVPSLPTTPSLVGSSPRMTAVKAQPAKPAAEPPAESSQLDAMKQQYAALQAQMEAMKQLMEKQGLQASPPSTPTPKQKAFSPVPSKAFSTPTPPQNPQVPGKASGAGWKVVPQPKQAAPVLPDQLKVPLPPVPVPQKVVAARVPAQVPSAPVAPNVAVAAPLEASEADVGDLHAGEEQLAEKFDLSAEDSLVFVKFV